MIIQGRSALEDLGPALDHLLDETGAPITARRPWLAQWVRHTPAFTPWVIGVGTPEHLEAAALLATRSVGLLVSVCDIGHGPSDYQALPARDGAAAVELAEAVAHALHALGRPWVLRINQLPDGDPVVARLLERLAHARTSPGVGSPTVRFGQGREVRDHLSVNGRKAVRKGEGRLRADERTWTTDVLRSRADVGRVLDELAAVRRERDVQARGVSNLDDAREFDLWRDVILTHAERDEVVVTVARVDGVVAAYAVHFRDGGAHRIWDLRYNPKFAHYNPGRVLGQALLAGALADPAVAELDWMNGEEPYKLSMANDVVPHVQLRAASSRWLLALDDRRSRRGAGAPTP